MPVVEDVVTESFGEKAFGKFEFLVYGMVAGFTLFSLFTMALRSLKK
jgi:hypothetical protein